MVEEADGIQVVPDPQEELSVVATSAEVCIVLCNSLFFLQFDSQVLEELGLDEVDFVNETPSFFETPPLELCYIVGRVMGYFSSSSELPNASAASCVSENMDVAIEGELFLVLSYVSQLE